MADAQTIEKTQKSSWLKKGLWLTAGLVALVLLVSSVSLLVLNSDWGRTKIASLISDTDAVSIARIDGSIFSGLTLSDVEISDAEGIWLKVPKAKLKWSPLPLLRRTVQIDDIQVPTITVLRAPVPAETQSEPFELTDITAQPVSVALDNLEISEIIWNNSDGSTDSVTVAATGRLVRTETIELALAVVPLTEGFDDEVNADFVLNTKDETAQTKLTVKASKGGLIASLAGLPGTTNAAITGGGSTSEWSGTITADVGGASVVDLKADYTSPAGQASGTIFVQPFLDPNLTDLAKTPFALTSDFKRVSAGNIAIDARIKNASTETSLAGLLSAPDRTPTVKDLVVDASATGMVAQTQLEALTAQMRANGQLGALSTTVKMNAKRVVSNDIAINALEASATAQQNADNLTASLQGGLKSIEGIAGLDLDLLKAIEFSADISAADELTGTAQVKNSFFKVAAESIAQDADGAIAANLAFEAPNLNRFPNNIEAALTGNASVNVADDGDISATLAGTLTPQKNTPHWIGRLARTPLNIRTRASVEGDDFTITNLTMKSDRTDVSGRAALRGETLDAVIKGRISGAAFADIAPSGSDAPATFDIAAKGPLSTVLPEGTVTLPGIAAADILIQDLALEFAPAASNQVALTVTGRSNAGPINANALIQRFENGDVNVGNLDARLANIIAKGSALVDVDAGPQADVTVALVPLRLTQTGLFGLSGDIELRAQLTNGPDGALSVEGGGPVLRYGPAGNPAAQLRDLAVEAAMDMSADIPKLVATVDAKSIEAAGLFFDSFNMTAKQSADTQTAKLTLTQNGPRPTAAVLDIDLKSDAVATIINVTPSGLLAAEPLGSDAPITIKIADEAMTIAPIALTIGGGRMELSASQNASSLKGDVNIQNFQVRTITDLLQQPTYQGDLNSQISLEATPGNGSLTTAFDIAGISAGVNTSATLQVIGKAAADMDNLTVQVQAGRQDQTQELVANAALPIRWPQVPNVFEVEQNAPINGDVALDIQLAPWWQLADVVDQTLSGALKGKIILGGTLDAFEPNGQIALDAIHYEHMEFGTQIEDMNGQIVLDKTHVALKDLTAKDGRGGTLNAEALVGLFPLAPESSQISLTDFQLLAKDGLSARSDAKLEFTSADGALGLGGSITIAEARYAISTGGAAAVPTLPIEEINKGSLVGQDAGALVGDNLNEEVEHTGLPPLDLDIKVNAPRRIFVTGMGLTSEWKTKLDITGTADTPNVAGSIQLVRGELEFAGKRFQLERGQIFLDGGDAIEPRLDILAQNVQGNFTARIGITGTPEDPQITLSSTPSLPDDEILSRILFGTSATDLSALEAVQLGSAVAALSNGGGGGALDIAGKARSATGLDRLSLGSNDSSTAITGGKYLSEDVYLQFTTDPGSGQYLAAIEWYLTRTLSVLSEYGAQTGSNVAARWSRTY